MKNYNEVAITKNSNVKLQKFSDKGRKIICILPPSRGANSNGINLLCSIYNAILTSAPTQIICVSKQCDASDHFPLSANVGKAFKAYSSHEKNALLDNLSRDQFILVRPDDLEGINNEIHWDLAKNASCHAIINILLAPPILLF